MTQSRTNRVLLVYRCSTPHLRPTTSEHLFSFQKYCPLPIDYHNVQTDPPLTRRQADSYDLILFHYLFLTHHWGGRATFLDGMRRARALRDARGVKAIVPQDEFYHADFFCEFIGAFDIDWIFSVAPESEWEKIYRTVDFRRVGFSRVLTGYIDEEKLRKVEAIGREEPDRPIDIGYRTAGKPYFWFGRHGYLKQQIADLFLERGRRRNLALDIGTRDQDTILGDDWYRFLRRCKYTIGVESGTSVLDWDGSVHEKTQKYVAAHPEAEFDEVEAACFPGRDGETRLFALSPRHFEACMTGTCQVLTEGEYNNALVPDVHYIQMRKDLSDVERVLDLIERDEVRQAMVERAHRDIVASGAYSYRRFVETVVEQGLRCVKRPARRRPLRPFQDFLEGAWMGAQRAWHRLARRMSA